MRPDVRGCIGHSQRSKNTLTKTLESTSRRSSARDVTVGFSTHKQRPGGSGVSGSPGAASRPSSVTGHNESKHLRAAITMSHMQAVCCNIVYCAATERYLSACTTNWDSAMKLISLKQKGQVFFRPQGVRARSGMSGVSSPGVTALQPLPLPLPLPRRRGLVCPRNAGCHSPLGAAVGPQFPFPFPLYLFPSPPMRRPALGTSTTKKRLALAHFTPSSVFLLAFHAGGFPRSRPGLCCRQKNRR